MRHPQTAGQLKAGQAVLALVGGRSRQTTWSTAAWWHERSCRRSTTPDGGTSSTAGSGASGGRSSGFQRISGRRNPAASATRTAPPGTAPRCRTATDSSAKRRFAQSLLELHNVLGHPNLPQSLSSSSLYHPPRKLKFVGNQETFWAEYKHPPGGTCARTLSWVYHRADKNDRADKNGGPLGSRHGSDPSWTAPSGGAACMGPLVSS